MSRFQLALNVTDLDDAIAYCSKLFATEPGKIRPGYANFATAEPPLKLDVIEGQAGVCCSTVAKDGAAAGCCRRTSWPARPWPRWSAPPCWSAV